jgi:hypothetical protein
MRAVEQQQARVLHRATGQHHLPSGDLGSAAVGSGDRNGCDPGSVGPRCQRDHGGAGAQQHVVPCLQQSGDAIDQRPAGSELVDPAVQRAGAGSQQRPVRRCPMRGLITERPQATDLLGPLIVRRQLGESEGPAAPGRAGRRSKVPRIERDILCPRLPRHRSVPDLRRATDLAEPRIRQSGVGRARHGPLIERLGKGVGKQAATLQHQNRAAGLAQRLRQRQPGRSRPDHADIGHRQTARQPGNFDQHAGV